MPHPNANTSLSRAYPHERSELDDLKARIDLADVIRASGVALKRTGKSQPRCLVRIAWGHPPYPRQTRWPR